MVLEQYIEDFQKYIENHQKNNFPYIEKEQLLSWLKELNEYRENAYKEMQRADAEDCDFEKSSNNYGYDTDSYGWVDDYEYYDRDDRDEMPYFSESEHYLPETDILNSLFLKTELTDKAIQALYKMKNDEKLSNQYKYLIEKYRELKNII